VSAACSLCWDAFHTVCRSWPVLMLRILIYYRFFTAGKTLDDPWILKTEAVLSKNDDVVERVTAVLADVDKAIEVNDSWIEEVPALRGCAQCVWFAGAGDLVTSLAFGKRVPVGMGLRTGPGRTWQWKR